MSLASQLLSQIANPALTHSERARLRCQLAKQLEEVGSYEAACEALGELWRGTGRRPNLDELDGATAAEVLLRAGVLTGWIGCVKQIEGAQETAKDLISESIRSFEELQDIEKMAEAQMELGHCYWHEGAFNEARDLLQEALSRLSDKSGDIKAITLLRLAAVEGSAKRFNEALRLDILAAALFEKSTNHALKGKFHNQFGFIQRNLGDIDSALIEYEAASYHFEQAGHTRYQAYVENNLGFLFGTIHKFTEAHEHLDRAQALFTRLKDKVHIARVDDTRARVLLEEGRVRDAEKFAKAAVRTLKEDDQQALFAEALTTHGIALARLGQYQHARITLQSAIEVAHNAGDSEDAGLAALSIIEELGEHLTADDLSITYQRALELLSSSRNVETHARLSACAGRVLFLLGSLPSPPSWKNFSLREAVRRYEGRIIEKALKDAGGIVTRAARMLGFRNHHSLVNKLNKHHRHLLSARTPVLPRKSSLMFIDKAEAEARPITILHAEDNDLVAGAVKDTLELEGWTVETVIDGASALKAIQSEAGYDVLIFDNELPGIEGIELIRLARRDPRRQQTPIIMLSASDIEKEARRAGANVFLRKPEEITVITETIARLLARRGSGRRTNERGESDHPA